MVNPADRTPDAGKPAYRFATVGILLNKILDDQPEISALLLKTIIIFCKKSLEIMKKYPIKYSTSSLSDTISKFWDIERTSVTVQLHTSFIFYN